MTECNGCGGCCDPVVLAYSHTDALTNKPMPEDLRQWILNVGKTISHKEGLRRAPHMVRNRSVWMANTQSGITWSWFYECSWYDNETKTCTHYDQRPDICRGYPWYGNPPNDKELPLECSFRADQCPAT